MSSQLEPLFQYYLSHQTELVGQFGGRVLVIDETGVVGNYATELEALEAAQKTHALGTFIIQKCSAGEDDYTQHFHSRVCFN